MTQRTVESEGDTLPMILARRRFTAAVAAVAAAATARRVRAQTLPAITIAASTFDSTTSGLYAVKAGLFQKAGLNVTLTPMNVAGILPALAGGTVQFANSNLLNVIEAHARKVPFTVVAPSALINEADVTGYVGLVVRKESAIQSGRDLNGKIVAVPSIGDLNTIGIRAWADKTGGDSTTLRFIEMPPTAALPAVVDGRVEGTTLTTPFLLSALDAGKVRLVHDTYTAIARTFLALGWLTTEDYAARNRDVVERFARTMHDANVYCNAHQSETVDMMAELGKQDPAVERRMKRILFAEYLTPGLVQPLIDAAARYKVIEGPFPAQELISSSALRAPR
jgi:NitT/TauT family transport system substrate-binding protein